MTSTATLQAALDVMKNKEPALAYSIAYPFGVIGPILCIYFMTQMVKPKFPAKAQRFHMGEISIGEKVSGQTLEEIQKGLPSGVQVTMVRKGGQNIVPSGDIALSSGDALLVVAEEEAAIKEAAARLGNWSLADWPRIVPTLTTSASLSAKPMWSACPCRAFRCPRASPLICYT